jgi:hypothetical protein
MHQPSSCWLEVGLAIFFIKPRRMTHLELMIRNTGVHRSTGQQVCAHCNSDLDTSWRPECPTESGQRVIRGEQEPAAWICEAVIPFDVVSMLRSVRYR